MRLEAPARGSLAKRTVGPLLAVLALGAMALLETWLAERRPLDGELNAGETLAVTSGADSGPGSLREAIYAANRSPRRVRITLLAPRMAPRRALPALANPHGVDLVAGTGGSVIDGGALATAPVLDVDAPGSLIRGLRIERAAGVAILVRAPAVRLIEVEVDAAGTAIATFDDARGLIVERCRLSAGGIGLHLDPASLPARVEECELGGHREAALWSVAPSTDVTPPAILTVRGNRFSDDRIGAVLGNVRAEVDDNTFERSGEAALYLLGSGVVARGNRIDDARRFGIVAEGASSATLIEDNEIRAAAAVGVLVRTGSGPTVRANRLDVGAYGIADVLGDPARPTIIDSNLLSSHRLDALVVVGGSPLLRRNRAVRNRGAAIRSLDFIDLGGTLFAAEALLEDNELEGNGVDGVVTGIYRARDEAAKREAEREPRSAEPGSDAETEG